MEHKLDIERYLRNSKKVDVSDLDFSQAAQYPLTDGEIRSLTYMMDVESHTIVYLRGILSTCAIEDPETTAFLSCWAYEEFFHGHTLRRLLAAAGVEFSPTRAAGVQKRASFREWLEEMGASLVCQLSRHFHAAYLTWGAIQELSTLEGYGVLQRRTGNPILAEVLRRLAKDERRHFSFYFNKARLHLNPRNAQRLTTFLLKRFWTPVGSGVKPDPEVDWMIRFVFGDEAGRTVAGRMDATIARLQGLQWFDCFSRLRKRSLGCAASVGLAWPVEPAQAD